MAGSTKLGFGDIQDVIAGIRSLTAAEKIQLQQNVIPRLTTTQRDALAGDDLIEGTLIYNTTTDKYNFRAAAAWEAITSA